MTTPLRLYELTGADDSCRFSPYCWRVRLALAHKGLPVETLAWRFHEKEAIAFSGQGKVPVLVDGEQWVSDSWAIAEYLDRQYPERPSLLGDTSLKALTRFINQWVAESVHPALARLILPDVHAVLDEADQDYFKRTREAAFGVSLEALAAQRDSSLQAFREVLKPLRSTLALQDYLAGDAPAYADHIVFGAFQWARVVSRQPLLSPDDSITGWCERMLDAYDGVARQTPAAAER
ncbi:glutathione S-transferase [Pseudomonas oryzihabitans]|uniref:glutathione S-transferase family protein n=1 Tax=Pseudomonas rhizoryzae TaxID=2571129 RepID=UPI0007371BCB|nr:glutathione S-transferase family protein [Pseudomonas rhizoryzae]APQ10696.1 glutathione S-transferase [Pseudomonas psychrotolerans]KTT07530.1 glutathione S-transferase [Pseudomonas psychrotolerans]KTT31104.1 glutathione S-transferase [Pseudomonas psychrotolerans]KTT35015.1 glutathione S-transferase [Pseudomonas psychrotolerans]KTT44230.1 glutathione S-transferase [Pseudomonas psychrotolerans]